MKLELMKVGSRANRWQVGGNMSEGFWYYKTKLFSSLMLQLITPCETVFSTPSGTFQSMGMYCELSRGLIKLKSSLFTVAHFWGCLSHFKSERLSQTCFIMSFFFQLLCLLYVSFWQTTHSPSSHPNVSSNFRSTRLPSLRCREMTGRFPL